MSFYKKLCFIAKFIFILIFVTCYALPPDKLEIRESKKEGSLTMLKSKESGLQPDISVPVGVVNKQLQVQDRSFKDNISSYKEGIVPEMKVPIATNKFNSAAYMIPTNKTISDNIKDTSLSFKNSLLPNSKEPVGSSKPMVKFPIDALPPEESSQNSNITKSRPNDSQIAKLPKKVDSVVTQPPKILESNNSYQSSVTNMSKGPPKVTVMPKVPPKVMDMPKNPTKVTVKPTKGPMKVTDMSKSPPVSNKSQQSFPFEKKTSEMKPIAVTKPTNVVKEVNIEKDDGEKLSDYSDSVNPYYDTGENKDNSDLNKNIEDPLQIDSLPNQVNSIPNGSGNVILHDKNDEIYDDANSHFFAYFLTMMVMVVLFYLLFHNKQRIIALMVEGRGGRPNRRSTRAKYHKLDNNLEETMGSSRGVGDRLGRIY